MMKFNILVWADEKLTDLKRHGIQFNNGIPLLPNEYIYTGQIEGMSTFRYRKDIPEEYKMVSVINCFMYEQDLWPRLNKIDHDIDIFREYGALAGMDLSPSIYMLRPRQKLSILINAIHSCYCGMNGVKILPNYRAGDLGTICTADYFPDKVNFIVGNHGCNNKEAKQYGEYILDIILRKKRPRILYIYGNIDKSEAKRLITKYGLEIITFPDRRNRVRNARQAFRYYLSDNIVCREVHADCAKRGGCVMGAKSIYLDQRKKAIKQLILSRDIKTIKGVLHDRDEYKKYAKDWTPVNLDEFVQKYDIIADQYINNRRKISFLDGGKTYSVVAAVGGKYFRIQEIKLDGSGGRYVGLNLKEPSISGEFQKADRRAERHRLTHFRMSYKKGTV